jgi:hypothetical protein
VNLIASPIVRKAAAQLAEFIIEAAAEAVSRWLLENQRQSNKNKLTNKEKDNVQLFNQNKKSKEPARQNNGLRIANN